MFFPADFLVWYWTNKCIVSLFQHLWSYDHMVLYKSVYYYYYWKGQNTQRLYQGIAD